MLNDIHHVAFVVESVDSAMEFIEKAFGITPISRERFEGDGVDLAIYQMGKTFFEVSAPLGADSALAQFLRARGAGIHHVAFGVSDVDAAMGTLLERGVNLPGQNPRTGRSGWSVVNIDSESELGLPLQLVHQAE